MLHKVSDNACEKETDAWNGQAVRSTWGFTYARDLRPALYKGLHATAARLVQKVVAGKASGNRALQVKLTKMFNVQELLTGMPSSVSRRTAPGLVTRFTR